MKKKQTLDEKYIENKLACIKAIIYGGLAGVIGNYQGSKVMDFTDIIYKHVEKQVSNIIKYQKRKLK